MAGSTATLVREAKQSGFHVEQLPGGHLKFVPPGGGQAIIGASTPSDYRSVKNTRARLKRAGLGKGKAAGTRDERVERARSHAQTASNSAVVLELLQRSVLALTADDCAAATGLTKQQCATALNYLARTHECVYREERGRFAFDGPNVPAPEVDEPEPSTFEEIVSTMFETVGKDARSQLVLRDEHGQLWVAAPLRALEPALVSNPA